MIGVFDSGHGGLTILAALQKRFPNRNFIYYGDHRNAPYGALPTKTIYDYTCGHVEWLMAQGCRLVVLACNTATAAALCQIQQQWLPRSVFAGKANVLGIIVPTIEAALNPQSKAEALAVFATSATVASHVYQIEAQKRVAHFPVFEVACPNLVPFIEGVADNTAIQTEVEKAVSELKKQCGGNVPPVILGCTHYELIRSFFIRALPAGTLVFSQPEIVAESLADYMTRHPEYERQLTAAPTTRYQTSGQPENVSAGASRFCGKNIIFI